MCKWSTSRPRPKSAEASGCMSKTTTKAVHGLQALLHSRPHLVLVQPDVGQPQRVVGHGVLAFRRSIGSPFPENVSYSRARDDEESTSTHPDLARKKTHINRHLTLLTDAKSVYEPQKTTLYETLQDILS